MNVTSAVRQAVERTSWFKKRQRYRVLYWREISPLAVPILLENACVLLMGVLSTFLVSWLGKEAMAGVGLADSFNMVIMSFFAAIDLGTTVVVVTHNGALAPTADVLIRMKSGKIESFEENPSPVPVQELEW